DDVSLRVPESSVFGFVGDNGAGKTTTMKLILGLLRADDGDIFVDGERAAFGKNRTNRLIGYLPDVPEFYGFLTPTEYLLLCGEISGVPKREGKRRAAEVLELVGLTRADRRIRGFSRGMKQRLGIAQALFGQPKLLICDEPTSALDPAGRREILDILHALKGHTTVLFSTHILSDVERICDECAVLHSGRLVKQGSLAELKGAGEEQGFVIGFLRAEDAEEFAALLPGGVRTDAFTLEYTQGGNRRMSEAMGLLAGTSLNVRYIERKERTLEDMFLGLLN
ncbi:MAG: ABC transporter ATP-binding protein, partial [Lachnospiraceae bacterium]|nr:ABC transporter ATP-binding protein [Lachnospiraceae bacterium]